MYVVNGATKVDVLVGTDVSVQREFDQVHVTFPIGDGHYLQEFSRSPEKRPQGISWVSYGHCDKVEKFLIDPDTPTELS